MGPAVQGALLQAGAAALRRETRARAVDEQEKGTVSPGRTGVAVGADSVEVFVPKKFLLFGPEVLRSAFLFSLHTVLWHTRLLGPSPRVP